MVQNVATHLYSCSNLCIPVNILDSANSNITFLETTNTNTKRKANTSNTGETRARISSIQYLFAPIFKTKTASRVPVQITENYIKSNFKETRIRKKLHTSGSSIFNMKFHFKKSI